VNIAAKDPEKLTAAILERFGVNPSVVGGRLLVERENGHAFVASLMEAFPGAVEAISLAKPTLEDVFIARTGHRFWEETR
jgi:ABC-2 type transport system ATP-binding protein